MKHFYLLKEFAREARRSGLSDDALREAVDRAEAGTVDADLGGGLIKQRVARSGEGRSGGFRTIIGLLEREAGDLPAFVRQGAACEYQTGGARNLP